MANLIAIDGSDVPGGTDNSSGVGSPLTADSNGVKIENIIDKEGGLLAVPFGRHIIGGHLMAHKYELGPPPVSTIIVGLGDAQGTRFDSVERCLYAGQDIPLSPDGVTEGYHFHPGTISTGIADPVQGPDTFLPGGLAYSGTASVGVKLPTEFAVEDRPDKLTVLAKCRWTMDYNGNGGELGLSYSTNPARAAADRIRRYYDQKYFNDLAYAYRKFRDRINWDLWVKWRDVNDTLISWDDGTTIRSIKRFEYHGVFTENATLSDVLDDICGNCAAIWQDDGELYNFLSPFETAPVHNFVYDPTKGIPSNIDGGSFVEDPRDIREIPNLIVGNFRNLDHEFLAPASSEVKRPELIQRIGKIKTERALCNMTHSQAQRILERQLRLEAGIDKMGTPVVASFRGDHTSFHVLPGDFVSVTHPVAGWQSQLCLVLSASPDTAESSADQTDFTVQRIDGLLYSDDWHRPIQANLLINNQPNDIPDLVFWYEARNTGYTFTDGAAVTTIKDLGPKAHDLTALAHTFRANGGNPYLDIASASLYTGGFDVNSILDLSQPDSFSCFFITRYKAGATGTAVNYLFGSSLSLTNLVRVLSPFTDGKIYVAIGDAFTGGQVSPAAPAAPTFDNLFHLWEFHRNGTAIECFYDGTPIAFSGVFAAATLVDMGPERCFVFGSGDTGIPSGKADHKAGILYRRYLSAGERGKIRNYLAPIV